MAWPSWVQLPCLIHCDFVSFLSATNLIPLGSQGGLVVIKRASHLCDPGSTLARVVCGLSFSRSQSDSEGFSPGTPVFLPHQKSTPGLFHQAVVLCSEVIHGSCSVAERLAGSTAPSVRPR